MHGPTQQQGATGEGRSMEPHGNIPAAQLASACDPDPKPSLQRFSVPPFSDETSLASSAPFSFSACTSWRDASNEMVRGHHPGVTQTPDVLSSTAAAITAAAVTAATTAAAAESPASCGLGQLCGGSSCCGTCSWPQPGASRDARDAPTGATWATGAAWAAWTAWASYDPGATDAADATKDADAGSTSADPEADATAANADAAVSAIAFTAWSIRAGSFDPSDACGPPADSTIGCQFRYSETLLRHHSSAVAKSLNLRTTYDN